MPSSPRRPGPLPDGLFDLGKRTRNEAIGFVFEGTLIVPADGKYTFTLNSDDGSKLTVAGKPILTFDGIHGEGEEALVEAVDLKQGRVPIRLDYFQAKFGYGLHVTWSGPDFEARDLAVGFNSDKEPAKVEKASPGNFVKSLRQEGPDLIGRAKVTRYLALRREMDKLKKQDAPADRALIVTEVGPKPLETTVMLRGNPHNPGDVVEPGFLQVVATQIAGIRHPGRRSEDDGSSADAGQLDRQPGEPAHRSRDGQPPLAISLRPRDRPSRRAT